MFNKVLNAPLVFYGIAILRMNFAGLKLKIAGCVSTLKRFFHNFTKYFPGTRVNQTANKCLNN